MNFRPLLLRSMVSVLLAATLPEAVCRAGGDERAASAKAARALRFRRVYAPADRVEDWPRGNVKYMPMEPAEFERLLKIAQRTASGTRPLLSARPVAAQYQARLVGDQLASGRGTLQVIQSAETPTLLPLDPCSLAIGKADWAGAEPGAATLGLGADGRLQVLVEDSGQLDFEWSLAGQRDADDVLNFQLELPACPTNSLILELPVDLTPVVDHGLVSQAGWTDETLRGWKIELGGHHRVRLRVLPAGAAQRQRQLPLVRESLEYHFSLRGLDLVAELKFEIHNGPLRQVTLALDRQLQLVGARYGDASIPWSVTSPSGSSVTRIALTLPEPVHDTERVLQLRALAPLTTGRRWRLPRIRPEGVSWQEGKATLLVPAPLLVKRLVPVGCRQTDTGPLSGSPGGESAQFQYSTPGATVEIILARRRAPLQLASGTAIELSDKGMTARVVADFRAREDALFSLQGDVSRRWLIDSVESRPPEAVDDWDLGKASGRWRKLTVRLAKPLSPAQPMRLEIHARRPGSPLGRKLGVDDLLPLRFQAPEDSRRLVAVRAVGPYQLSLSGDDELNRIAPGSLDALQRELFAELPEELLFENDPDAAQLGISLESRRPDDVPEPPEQAITVSRSGDPATPPAWVWDCHLESRYEASGAGRHLASYRLQNSGGGVLQLDLPSPVKPKNIQGVRVGGDRVPLHRLSAGRAGRLTIDLPRGEKFPAVSVRFSTPPARLGTIGSLTAPLPEVDLNVLAQHWTVWLPPGYEAYDSDPDWQTPTAPRQSWSRRLFGPLGRAAGEGAFDPLAATARFFAPAGTLGQPPPPVETPQGPLAEPKLPWTQTPSAAGEPADTHGWNTYHLQVPGTSPAHAAGHENAPPAGRLKFVHRQTVRLLGSVTFLLVIALGWWIAGQRPAVLSLLAGGFGCAALLLPEAYVPIASGAVLGTLFCLAYRLIRGRSAAGRPPAGPTAKPDPPRAVSAATLLGALVFVAAAVGAVYAVARGAQPEPGSTPPAPPVHRVFIPVDQDGQPTGDKYYVPEEIYIQLDRLGAAATEKPHGWLIKAALYRGALSRETTSQRLVLEELKADFALQVFDAATPVRIPLGREGANLLPDGALLDSRVVQPEWDADGGGLLLEVPQPGEYHLELSLRPSLRSDAAGAGFDLNIPPLATSRLELSVPPGTPPIQLPSAVGVIRSQDEPPRLVAELGPSSRLRVRWPGGAGRAVTASALDVEELLWMKVQHRSVVVDAKLKFKITEGQLRQVRLVTDPRLRLLPLEGDDPPAVEARSVPGQPQTLTLRWPAPVSDQVVLNARFMLTGTSGVGNLRLPQLKVLDARSIRRWLAVSVDAALEYEQPPPDRLEAVAVPDFLGSWGPSESQPQLAYRLPPGETAWGISTRLCEPRTRVEQKLALSFDRGSVAVQFDAQLVPTAGYVFQHRLLAPAALRVEDVSVLEEGEPRAARWSQDEKGTITVFLSELMAGPQKLSLRGQLPTRGRKMQLPLLQIDRAQMQSSTIELFRRPAVLVKLDQANGLVEVDDPLIDANDPARWGVSADAIPAHRRGRLVGQFRAQGEGPIKATLTLTPNRPKVRAEQVTRPRCDGGSWKAEIDCRVRVTGGVLDQIRIDVPSPLGEPFQISPPAEPELIDTPGRPRQLIVRPPAAIEADYQFSVSSPLTITPGDRPSAPQVLLRQVDQLKRFLALPKEADGQPIEWKKEGLKQTDLPDGFVAPPDAETFLTYEVVGKPYQAVLSRSHTQQDARVRLADVQIAWQADRSCVGVALFDLEPGRSRECRLWLPSGYRLLQVSVAGVPAEPAPAEPVSAHTGAWRVPLGPARLPQRIEVLFSGRLSKPASAASRSFEAPTLGRLPVERTLWTVVGPSLYEPGQPEDGSLISPRPHEFSRLKSIAALIESASTVPAEDPEETLRWYRRWARRLAAARTALQRRPAPDGPSKKTRKEELDAIDARQSQIAERLGVTELYERLKGDGASAADDPEVLWQQSLARRHASTRCTIPKRSGSITLSYRRAQTTGLPYRLAGAAGLVAVIVLVVLGLRRGTLAEYLKRWPQAIGVAVGLAWWLWLWPSILGWGIVLVSLAAALRPGWKYSPPAPGSAVISLRTRQR